MGCRQPLAEWAGREIQGLLKFGQEFDERSIRAGRAGWTLLRSSILLKYRFNRHLRFALPLNNISVWGRFTLYSYQVGKTATSGCCLLA
jgi:hypothetical protein